MKKITAFIHHVRSADVIEALRPSFFMIHLGLFFLVVYALHRNKYSK